MLVMVEVEAVEMEVVVASDVPPRRLRIRHQEKLQHLARSLLLLASAELQSLSFVEVVEK